MEFTQSLQDSLFIASFFIAALFIICTVSLALRNYEIRHELKKLKKWRKFSEIEKAQKHEEYDKLATELAEERTFNDTQGDMHVRLMLKYAAIQEQDDKNKQELKIAQTCLKVAETEISDLKAKLSRKNLKRDEKGRVLPNADRDWTTATKEELLAEAKRRYPVGTKFKDAHALPENGVFIANDDFKYVDAWSYSGVQCGTNGSVKIYVWTLVKGWAQIITE